MLTGGTVITTPFNFFTKHLHSTPETTRLLAIIFHHFVLYKSNMASHWEPVSCHIYLKLCPQCNLIIFWWEKLEAKAIHDARSYIYIQMYMLIQATHWRKWCYSRLLPIVQWEMHCATAQCISHFHSQCFHFHSFWKNKKVTKWKKWEKAN